MNKYIIFYLAIINMAGFAEVYRDKAKSIKKQWRTPESRFFIISALFGGIGVLIGMHTFRHKTRHIKFTLGIPAIIALQAAAVYMVLK
ncbi:MAG: hypothetical protein H6Q58_1972, partial [Firmicutes bacterium]|nr:hypothetical protein [Bacillota bacterium]